MRFLDRNIENLNKLTAETIDQGEKQKSLLDEHNRKVLEDLSKAKEFIGETAELKFMKEANAGVEDGKWIETGLSGNDLSRANLATSANGKWVVELEFNDKGTKKDTSKFPPFFIVFIETFTLI